MTNQGQTGTTASRSAHASAEGTEREAVALAHEAIHETVARVLGDGARRGLLLDVPAGEGALAARLRRVGFDVRCCDLYPEIFRLRDVEITRGDLSGMLPYADEAFDVVTCVEGLEHIENPQQAVREFARILRAGGELIVTVPNILNIEERVKWLLNGYTSHFKPISREALARVSAEFGGMEEVALHINPISYAELRYTLEKYGFRILRLYRDKPKAHLWLYWPLVALIRLVGSFNSAARRRERWSEELQSDEILLGGNTLIVHAAKESSPMNKLSHLDAEGRVAMVDTSAKETTARRAVASARVLMSAATVEALRQGRTPKGDPLETARLAGIMAAKRTADLIPLCHPLALTHVEVRAELQAEGVYLEAEAATRAGTGVEMEALTSVSVAALTVYDMCKALDKAMTITDVRLERKTGGKSGDYERAETQESG